MWSEKASKTRKVEKYCSGVRKRKEQVLFSNSPDIVAFEHALP